MLKVGVITSPRAPPFVIYDEKTKEYSGIAIDIWKKIAEEKDYKYKFIDAGKSYKTAVENIDKYDIVIGDTMKTKSRTKTIDFSIPYYLSRSSFAERENNIYVQVGKYIIYFLSILFTTILILTPISILLQLKDQNLNFEDFKNPKNLFNFLYDGALFTSLSIIYRKPSFFKPYSTHQRNYMIFLAIVGFFLLCFFIAGMIEIFKKKFSIDETPFKDNTVLTKKNKKNRYKIIKDKYATPVSYVIDDDDSLQPLLDEFVREKKYDNVNIYEDKGYFYKKRHFDIDNKYDDVKFSKQTLGWNGRYFIMPKKSKLLKDVNIQIMKLRDANDTKKIVKKYLSYRLSRYAMV